MNSWLAFPMLASALVTNPGEAPTCSFNNELSLAGLKRELTIVNSQDRVTAYEAYVGSFDSKAKVYGLVPERAATVEDVANHYRTVFFELDGGTLVEDESYAVGPMAAHRYHSMLTLNGTFDGVEAQKKPVILRGQTFFRFGGDGKIIERWSNHDHAYRMGQLLGEKGRMKGEQLGEHLNGPGLSEADGYRFVESFATDFSRAETPELRRQNISGHLSDGVTVHGLTCLPGGKQVLVEHMDNLWSAFPDLVMTVIGKPASGWSMVAFRWKAVGSLRGSAGEPQSDGRAAADWRGEAIMRLDDSGRAEEIWWKEEPVLIQRFEPQLELYNRLRQRAF